MLKVVNTLVLMFLISPGLTEDLLVKCGDEKCEKTLFRGTTVLKYTPNASFKVPLNSVNANVEILGIADPSYYYVRSSNAYGFVPKNNIRENNKGKPTTHEFNISTDSLSPVRTVNFLSSYLSAVPEPAKSSEVADPPSQEVPSLNSTSNETIQETQDSKEVPVREEADDDEGIVEDGDDEEEEDCEGDDCQSEEENSTESDSQETSTETPSLQVIPDKESPEIPQQSASDKEQQKTEETITKEEVKSDENLKLEETKTENVDKPPQLPNDSEKQEIKTETEIKEIENNATTLDTSTLPAEAPEQPANPNEVLQGIPPSAEDPQFYPEKEDLPEIPGNTVDDPKKVSDVLEEAVKNLDKAEEKPKEALEEIKIDQIPPVIPETTEKPQEVPTENIKPEEKNEESINIPGNLDVLVENSSQNPEKPKESTEQPSQIPVESNEQPTVVPKQAEEISESSKKTEESNEPPSVQEKSEESTETPKVPEESTEIPKILEPFNVIPDNSLESNETVPDFKSELPQIPSNLIDEVTDIPTLQEQFNDVPSPIIEPLKTPPAQEDDNKRRQIFDSDPLLKRFDRGIGSAVEVQREPEPVEEVESQPEITSDIIEEEEESPGFFKNLVSKFWKEEEQHHDHKHEHDDHEHKHEELQHEHPESLFMHQKTEEIVDPDSGYCEKLTPNQCPSKTAGATVKKQMFDFDNDSKSVNEYVNIMLNEAVQMMDFIITMGLTGLTLIIFILGYYCINKSKKEGPLIAKINELERQLMVTSKENTIVKGDLMDTRQKLLSIEDSSFGSNDMVIALKQDLEMMQHEKYEMQEQVASLEKELETAAEAGLELNKMVSELLNNQSGSDSIISSVEELQRQLNEQQDTIFSMNEALAVKSRENSEMQIQISELTTKLEECEQIYTQELEDGRLERSTILLDLDNLKKESDIQVNNLIEERNSEISRLNRELTTYSNQYEEVKKKLSAAESKYLGLEETLGELKKSSKPGDFKNIMDVADLKADLLAVSKEKSYLQDRYQNEAESRKLLEDRIKSITEELSSLKQEFSLAEKDKLEAQTRLEVLSNYFKDKETQLQKELSVKEAMWMKQQGETTSTVEKVRSLNEENQTLKSQNDSLRAEIEAQLQAHKAQISALEARSHEAWLNARQAERRLEESRMESAHLRRKLTSIAENPAAAGSSDLIRPTNSLDNDSLNMPSPIRVESPNGPPGPNLMGVLPPPPFLAGMGMPPPFIPGGPHPPFMPPFIPPPPSDLSMRAPPLGRLMSPPPKRYTPPSHRYSPNDRSGRYSPDSRYDYSNFEETDYSPPPSPSPTRRRPGHYSPPESDRSRKSKGSKYTHSSYSDSDFDGW